MTGTTTTSNMGPFRQVEKLRVSPSKYSKPGQGTRVLHLSCGHFAYRKTSVPIPARVRCKDCLHQTRTRTKEEGGK